MMNQSKGNQNGCCKPKRNVDEGIGSVLEGLGAYVCDKLCVFEKDITCDNCKLSEYINRIETEYEKINTFSKSAAYALMEKYRNIVLCKDCIYRAHEKTGYDWCRLAKGLDESLGESEGCSRGKEKE